MLDYFCTEQQWEIRFFFFFNLVLVFYYLLICKKITAWPDKQNNPLCTEQDKTAFFLF